MKPFIFTLYCYLFKYSPLPGKDEQMKQYRYYLFDADGTLFDTTGMICSCFKHTAEFLGSAPLSDTQIISNIGLTLRDQMEVYFGKMTDQKFESIRKYHMDYQLSIYRQYLRLFPGVGEGLKELKEGGKRCAVVTSRMKNTLELYLSETGILQFFEYLVTPEDTTRHKPEPDPAIKALELLGGRPEEALFVGDSIYDIECGKNAGTDTAFVKWSLTEISDLTIKPTHIISDMRELCLIS